MSQAEIVFEIGNLIIVPFWALMILAPKSKVCRTLLKGPQVIVALCVLYGSLTIPLLAELLPMLAKPNLDQIRELLSSPIGASAAWLHFLAFDLFVGRYVWREALDQGRSTFILRFCLVFCLMFGPLGYLFHLCWKSVGGNSEPPKLEKGLQTLSTSMLWLVALCLVGLALDPRTVVGSPAWIKPLKFALSTLIYALSLEAILKRLEQSSMAFWVRAVTSVCLGIDLLIIVIQAIRGTTSHYNLQTPLDSVLFAIMGLCVIPIWLMILPAMYLIWREREKEPHLALALCWGGAITFVGMAWAWIMTSQGSHTVGLPDGGPGLPILGWSTVAGDLRVSHFVGLHALQIMAAFYFLRSHSRAWIHGHGVALLSFVCYLAFQALDGRSAFSWDPVLAAGLLVWLFLSFGVLKMRPRVLQAELADS